MQFLSAQRSVGTARGFSSGIFPQNTFKVRDF